MKKRPNESGRRTTLDLFEEAVHLLRRARSGVLGWYYLGTLPFVLALLYFWADMSWSASALQDTVADATGVSIAFIWMKFCQSMAARRLGAQLRLDDASIPGWRAAVRILLQQTIIQPSKLFVLPVALIATIPFAWVCAFYENATILGEEGNVGRLWTISWRQARLWPRQNHLALSIFTLLYLVMGLNMLLLVLSLPHLFKMLSGVENVFTRSGIHSLNSTVLAVAASATYLCCDPLMKAIYALRCFYGESLQSGEDLQIEVRRLRLKIATALCFLALFVAGASGAFASPASSAPPPSLRSPQELSRSISETMAQPEFRWRMPREEVESDDRDPALVRSFKRFLRRTFHTIGKWWDAFMKWLEHLNPNPDTSDRRTDMSAGNWSRHLLEACLVGLCAALLVFVGIKVRDYYRERKRTPRAAAGSKSVDLSRDNVTADQLPEDEWLRLAAELMARGEWRFALRAFFLAGLAHLSKRDLIAIARHKSNRDYAKELRRRVPAQTSVHEAFALNLRNVERSWYGEHEVSAEILETFQANLNTIRAL